MQGSVQQPDYNSTKTIFHERNDLVLFILSDMYDNMNIRYNQKLMFYKDHGIDFSI